MEEVVRKKASSLMENGNINNLHDLIQPYIADKDPYALYLYSCYSLVEFNESEEQFTERRMSLLSQASDAGIAEASYRLGVCYLYGDDVKQNKKTASQYFESAINQGHSYTKFTYGFSLFYGNDDNQKDEKRGLALIKEAAKEGIELAIKELEIISKGNNA